MDMYKIENLEAKPTNLRKS